jgi:hypothetical protein
MRDMARAIPHAVNGLALNYLLFTTAFMFDFFLILVFMPYILYEF